MYIVSVLSDYMLPSVSIYRYLNIVTRENIFYADLLSIQRKILLPLATDDVFRCAMISSEIKITLQCPVANKLSRLFPIGKSVKA
jgi:hypothetical protein